MLKILLVNSRKLRIKEERKPTENEIIDTLKNKILKNNNDNKVYDKIPYTVYQTYQTKTLPVKMLGVNIKLKLLNSDFSFKLFDDNDCREFIEQNFNSIVLETFDNLLPGAFKSDLWKYCILYLNGGIYLDMKLEPIDDFKLNNLIELREDVLDKYNDNDYISINNGLLFSVPNNIAYLKCINVIIENVKNLNYNNNSKAVTGSILLGRILKNSQSYSYDLKNKYKLFTSDCGEIIFFNKNPILKFYNGYIDEKYYNLNTDYNFLWKKKYVFKNSGNYDLDSFNELNKTNKLKLLEKLKNNYFNFVDKIIYINLKHREDRRKLLDKELDIIIDEKIIRFNAILEKDGCIGCTKSHIQILEMCIYNKWGNCLIIEDDMVWNNFNNNYNTLLNLLKNNFDVILLGGIQIKYNLDSYKLISAVTTTAYLVNNNYYIKLLNNFKEGMGKYMRCENIKIRKNRLTIDQYWKLLQNKDNWYIVVPGLSFQRNGYSDISKINITDWHKLFKNNYIKN
jgi:hypothetical protein